MNFDYSENVSALSPEQRLHFYELLAHNLTISIRAIWSDEEISLEEKVDRLKWVNEILHGVTAKIFHLRLQQNNRSEMASWESIKHWIMQNPAIGGDVGWAIQKSYDCAIKLEA